MGIRNTRVAPFENIRSSTQMEPLWASTIALAMESPAKSSRAVQSRVLAIFASIELIEHPIQISCFDTISLIRDRYLNVTSYFARTQRDYRRFGGVFSRVVEQRVYDLC
jgi:hypothetical protein